MNKEYIFHPFLIAMYIVLAPLAHNIQYVGITAIRSLILAVAGTVLLVNFLNLLIKDRGKTSLLTTVLILLFFSFGHLEPFIRNIMNSSFINILMLIGFISLYTLLAFLILKKLYNTTIISNYLNFVGIILIIFPLYTIFTYSRQSSDLEPIVSLYQSTLLTDDEFNMLVRTRELSDKDLTDIYYIILDGYTRADVLNELYDYDNSYFISALEQMGFVVADASMSNYSDTVYSLSSALNMSHVNNFPEYMEINSQITNQEVYKDALSKLIHESIVLSFFQEQGYEIVAFDSGYPRTTLRNFDYYEKSSEIGEFNARAAFELMLFHSSIGKHYLNLRGDDYEPLQTMFDEHRVRILYIFENLPKYAGTDGNHFVFAHILSPHSPYVFGPDGEERRGVDPFTLLDTSGTDWRPNLYRDQVTFINKKVIEIIDEILTRSDPKPIIIIQADHSSRSFGERQIPNETKVKLLFPILNAVYLPGVKGEEIYYPTISPVNTFRVILNEAFGTNLDLVDDTSYIFINDAGFTRLENICENFINCYEK